MSEQDERLVGGMPHSADSLRDYMAGDDFNQLPLYTERELVAEQEPYVIRALGAYCMARASEFLSVAQHCQDELVELEEITKPRTRPVDLTKRAAVFEEPAE